MEIEQHRILLANARKSAGIATPVDLAIIAYLALQEAESFEEYEVLRKQEIEREQTQDWIVHEHQKADLEIGEYLDDQ